jgi:hypothetical protein
LKLILLPAILCLAIPVAPVAAQTAYPQTITVIRGVLLPKDSCPICGGPVSAYRKVDTGT